MFQSTSASADTAAAPEFQVLWWDAAVVALTCAMAHICIGVQCPPARCLSLTNGYGKARAQDSAGLM